MNKANIFNRIKGLLVEFLLLRRLAPAFGWLVGGGSVSTLLMALSMFAVAAHVGAKAFGVMAIISSTVFLFAGVISLRTTEALTKFLTDTLEHRELTKAGNLVGLGILVDGLSALTATALLLLGSSFLVSNFLGSDEYLRWFQIFSFVPILLFCYPTSLALLRVANKFSIIAAIDMANAVCTLSGNVYLIIDGASWTKILAWTVVVAALKGLMLLWSISYALKALGVKLSFNFSFRSFCSEFREVISLMFSSTSVNIIKTTHTHLDILIIGHLLGPASSGAYKLARNIMQLLAFPTNALFQISFPEFSKLIVKRKIAEFRETLRLLMLGTFGLSVMYCLGVWFVGPLVLPYLAGESYQEGFVILPALVVGLSITLISQYWHAALVAVNCAGQVALSMSFALLVQVGLLLMCVPLFGIQGAALGYVGYSLTRALFLYSRFDLYVLKRLPEERV